MLYERGNISKFDENKYSIENYMQIIEYNPSCKKYEGYEGDDEMPKQIDFNFINVMNGLAEKLEKFTMSY